MGRTVGKQKRHAIAWLKTLRAIERGEIFNWVEKHSSKLEPEFIIPRTEKVIADWVSIMERRYGPLKYEIIGDILTTENDGEAIINVLIRFKLTKLT